MQALLDSYRDPLLLAFPVATTLISMAAFLLFALPLTALAAADPRWCRRWRIQSRRERRDVFWPSVRSWWVNNLWLTLAVLLAWPLLLHSGIHTGPLPPWYVIAGSVLLIIYLDDFLYYGFHRLMHRPWAFRHIHGCHHRIHTPWAITGHYMHPAEYVATGSIALIGPILLEVHVVTLWIWTVFRQWEAAEGHCGYAFPVSLSRWLPFSDGGLHHDYHHAKVRGNYAGFLGLWDRVFGTEVPDYPAHRARLRQAAGQTAP